MNDLPTVPSADELRAIAAASLEVVTEWETAFHEAGHVVMEVAWGSYPDEVWLNLDGARGDDHAGRTTSRSFLGNMWASAPENTDAVLLQALETRARKHAEVLFAGELARSLALGLEVDVFEAAAGANEGWNESADEAALASLVTHLGYGDAEEWLAACAGRSLEILRACWTDVELLARMLVQHRHLDRPALWEALEGGPAERFAEQRLTSAEGI